MHSVFFKKCFLVLFGICLVLGIPTQQSHADRLPLQVQACPLPPKPTPTVTPAKQTAVPLPSATPSLTPEEVISQYYDAVIALRFEEAVPLSSDYSFTFFNLTQSDLVNQLVEQSFNGFRILEYKLLKTQSLSDRVKIVTVVLRRRLADGSESSATIKVVVVLENGAWRINLSHNRYGGLVDYRLLSVPPKTVANVTIQPISIVRYTNGIVFTFCIQNKAGQGLLWTWVNQLAGTFYFKNGSPCDVAGKTPPTGFEAKRTYPDAWIAVENCALEYPTRIVLKGWHFSDGMGLPTDFGEGYSFTFDLP